MADSVREAIFALLVNDAALVALLPDAEHIYHRSSPQDVDFPMVVLQKQSGITSYAFGTSESARFGNEIWTVKGVDRGLSSERAEELDAAIFVALQDKRLEDPPASLAGITTMWFRREEDINYGEREEGAIIHHVGAMYRLLTEPA
jgi:Protein of unknown function (DUF3168)